MNWNPAFTPGPWYYAHGMEYCYNKERAGIIGVIQGLEASSGPSYTPQQSQAMDPDTIFDVTIAEVLDAQGGVDAADGITMSLAPEMAQMLWRVSQANLRRGTPLSNDLEALLARIPQKDDVTQRGLAG